MRADAGCLGAKKCEALKDSTAEFVVARRRSNYKKQDELDPVRKLIEKVEHAKASICSKVKHVFHEVTNMFRYSKCRYKGLAKNTVPLQVLFAMANLVLSQRTRCTQ